MASLWPWLALAAVGALHGLNPANGWALAAARGVGSGDRTQALRALVPLALGHVASLALVIAAVLSGRALERGTMVVVAAGLLLLAVVVPVCRRARERKHRAPLHADEPRRGSVSTTPAALALWSFLMSGLHGAGLMLVPALVPLCMGEGVTQDLSGPGSLVLAVAGIAVHTASMLAVTALIASGICRGVPSLARWLHRRSLGRT
jgi:hypothetical protein